MAAGKRDVRFIKFLIIVNAPVPGAFLAWDAAHAATWASTASISPCTRRGCWR